MVSKDPVTLNIQLCITGIKVILHYTKKKHLSYYNIPNISVFTVF